jgi:uncharacterized protein DUF2188
MAKQRTVFEVSYKSKFNVWEGRQTRPKKPHIASWHGFKNKSELVQDVIKTAKKHKPSQVVIKGRNGRIQTEYTYGNDPRRTPG